VEDAVQGVLGQLSFLLKIDHLKYGQGQVAGVGGGADLIVYDPEGIAFAAQAKHGFYEIVSKGGVHPGGADDGGSDVDRLRHLFAFQFGPGINALWLDGVRFEQGPVQAVVVDVIGGEMNEVSAVHEAGSGQMAHAFYIDSPGSFGFAFGLVDSRIGGAIQTVGKRMFVEKIPHLRVIRDIQAVSVCKLKGKLGILITQEFEFLA
jgi:hypothetical protein